MNLPALNRFLWTTHGPETVKKSYVKTNTGKFLFPNLHDRINFRGRVQKLAFEATIDWPESINPEYDPLQSPFKYSKQFLTK